MTENNWPVGEWVATLFKRNKWFGGFLFRLDDDASVGVA